MPCHLGLACSFASHSEPSTEDLSELTMFSLKLLTNQPSLFLVGKRLVSGKNNEGFNIKTSQSSTLRYSNAPMGDHFFLNGSHSKVAKVSPESSKWQTWLKAFLRDMTKMTRLDFLP